ncbi:hypothetical protein RFI_38171, partial [Reticulomyxa filosa]
MYTKQIHFQSTWYFHKSFAIHLKFYKCIRLPQNFSYFYLKVTLLTIELNVLQFRYAQQKWRGQTDEKILSESLWLVYSSMKSLLVLVVLHVLNVFAVVLNASERNTSNCSWTNKQKYFNQHININIMAISSDRLLNQMWKSETLTCEQCLQLYNNTASASSLQISNNKSMQSTNKIIRIFQSTLSANTKQSKKNLPSKTSTMSVFIPISTIQQTTHKYTFTAATFRNDFFKKTKITAMAKWKSCNSIERVSIVKNGCELSRYNAATYTNITSRCRFSFPTSCCTIQAGVKHKFVQNSTRSKFCLNFGSITQCCNIFDFAVQLIKQKWRTTYTWNNYPKVAITGENTIFARNGQTGKYYLSTFNSSTYCTNSNANICCNN